MTREEAAGVIKFEKACVLRQDTPRCNRDCKKCDLLLPTEDVLTAYDMAIKALEQEPSREFEDYENCKECRKDWTKCGTCSVMMQWLKDNKQEPCEDAVSRQRVIEELRYMDNNGCITRSVNHVIDDIRSIPSVKPLENQPQWIPVSEKLPKAFEFVNCTCHSLIDDREDWVIETIYVPQPSDSPYSDWGNIPMLNSGDCKVVAWVHRGIPEPYKAENEVEE